MFAFAIWDTRADALILARDRLGQKPLYYTFDHDRFVFASEIKAILEYPGIQRDVDLDALNLYLTFLYVPAPWTMFKGIQKLPPASVLVCRQDSVQIEKYWEVVHRLQKRPSSDIRHEVRERLIRAVERRLISDVPLGAFLSGGVDSSIVVAIMTQLMGHPVDTYSVGFDPSVGGSSKFNVDRQHAQLVARHLGTNHHEVLVGKEHNLPALFTRLVWELDEPISNPIIISTHLVSRLAKRTVTVALSGDGADELFGGYSRYVSDKIVDWYRLVPEGLRHGLIEPLLGRGARFARFGSLFEKAALPPSSARYLVWWAQFDPEEKRQLFAPNIWANVNPDFPASVVARHLEQAACDSFWEKLSYVDMKMWIAEESNMRVDKMSMLASLEARAPFLDHELIEFAATIPSFEKIKGLASKYILKRTFSDLLPREILRRPKWGFFSPASHWLRSELRDLTLEILGGSLLKRAGLFQADYVDKILQGHISKKVYNLNKVWALLTFQIWYEIFIAQNGDYLGVVEGFSQD